MLPGIDLPLPPYCILFVGANNSTTAELSLEEEFKKARDAFSFRSGSDFWHQRVMFERHLYGSKKELAQGLLKHKPVILHFASHGQKSALELFQGDVGVDNLLQALAGWSDAGTKKLHLIVANACDSSHFVQSLSQHVDFVIGHHQPVEDHVAINFAESLYLGLGAEQSLLESFSLARLNLPLYCMTGRKNAANFALKGGQLIVDAGYSVSKCDGHALPDQDTVWAPMPVGSDVRVVVSEELDQDVSVPGSRKACAMLPSISTLNSCTSAQDCIRCERKPRLSAFCIGVDAHHNANPSHDIGSGVERAHLLYTKLQDAQFDLSLANCHF